MATTIKKTVKPSGGDFTTLADALYWFYTNYPNFVTSDIIGEIEISGTWETADTSPARTFDPVTGANNYLYIHTDSSNKAGPSWSNSKYRLITNNSNFHTLTVACPYTIVDGLQLEQQATINYLAALGTGDLSGPVYYRNIFAKSASGSAIGVQSGSSYIYNVVAIASSSYVGFTVSGGTHRLYNCVTINGTRGFEMWNATVTLKNNYAQASSAAYWQQNSTVTMVTCASSDGTGSTGLTNIDLASAGFVSIISGSEDFHLASTSSPLYHTGTDTSGDTAPMNFTTDIDGDNYYDTGGVRSIGVDEYVEGGEPTGPYRSIWINFSWS